MLIILCTSPPMTLHWNYCCLLLESWTAGMPRSVVMFNNDIMFHNLSPLIKFFLCILHIKLRLIFLYNPNSKTAKITVLCIVQVSRIDLKTNFKWQWKWMFQSVNTSYSLRIRLHVSDKKEKPFRFCYSAQFNLGILGTFLAPLM